MEDVSVNLSEDVASIFRGLDFLNVQNDFFCLEINERRNFKPSLSLEFLHYASKSWSNRSKLLELPLFGLRLRQNIILVAARQLLRQIR